ncbi:fatty acid desaturase [Synechococcus sp. BA-124 BA4]|jgi:acyl-lipid omega-6 desaturase (Delta-12 desaturase)|uniref:fatty acid desaturase n=1 Tax=unclassified Synechococcus TaxID=2626047 RepID=UPI0018CF416F|nr:MULTISPECIES: fatty acid desaturase [unclassified Synechococcus]MEA5399054.1 fatty acid desaturase [Synechococcus sp. BA-124 BA4]CAK6699884.1 Fatty acid desaturase [Synechococcus sp. CBW1107]
MASDDRLAVWQILSTVGAYLLLWVATLAVAHVSLWLTPPLLVVLVLLSGRCFSLMHDCGHQSLFSSKRLNRAVGFVLGVINAIPQYPWSQGHAYHHKHNGNWDLYRGPSALISLEQYEQLSPGAQGVYRLLRHPLMLFPGGFFYLVIKPRLALLLGTVQFLGHVIAQLRADWHTPWPQLVRSFQSKQWYSEAEFIDLLLNNLCVITSWVLLSHWIGAGLFWSLYSLVMAASAALFICIFFVQHNFEGSYAHRSEGWDPIEGAITGTSLLVLPGILNWFTADIGCHNIHHLCERIPNYHLRACQEGNAALLSGATRLTIADIPRCFKYVLWDRQSETLSPIPSSSA